MLNPELAMCLAGNLCGLYIISCFFGLFFETGGSRKRKYFRAACYTFYYLFNSTASFYLHWPPILILSTNFIGCAIVSCSYKGRWKHRICAILLIMAVNIICEDAVYYYLRNLQVQYINLIGIQVTNLIAFMLVLLLQKAVDLKNGEEIALSEWFAVLIIPICSLFVSVVILNDCDAPSTVAVGSIGMLLMNVLLFFLLERIQRMHRGQLQMALLEQQNLAYEKQLLLLQESEEKLSILRHDFNNHLLMLKQLTEEKRQEEAEGYIENLITLVKHQKKIADTGNPVIDGFLNQKLNEALSLGAEVETHLHLSRGISLSPRDICIISGNLLDNALEALKNCEEKVLTVAMRENPGVLQMEIRNSYAHKIEKVGNVLQTTKLHREGHGIGLKNVRRIVEAYHGEMMVDYTDTMFTVKLILFI